jgi:hypothetical protein
MGTMRINQIRKYLKEKINSVVACLASEFLIVSSFTQMRSLVRELGLEGNMTVLF